MEKLRNSLNKCEFTICSCEVCAKKYEMPYDNCCLYECCEHEFCRSCKKGIHKYGCLKSDILDHDHIW